MMSLRHKQPFVLATLYLSASVSAASGGEALGLRGAIGKTGHSIRRIENIGLCEVGCETSFECDLGLNCYDPTNLPEYSLGPIECPDLDSLVAGGVGFCYKPRVAELSFQGENGLPKSSYPLQECQGTCVEDQECDAGLICQLRNGDERIRGCSGSALSAHGYCVRPAVRRYHIGECETGCDNDHDCKVGLKCKLRTGDEAVPNCTPASPSQSGANMCYVPGPGEVVHVGNDWIPRNVFPLGECQGDCDDDEDCGPGLVCLERYADEDVPGCSGVETAITKEDYCVRPSEYQLVIREIPKLQKCEGNCVHDTDCEDGLVCFHRPDEGEEAYMPIPGCSGYGSAASDYCFNPEDEMTAADMFHIGECETGCMNDAYCKPGLVCRIREFDEGVFGCDTSAIPDKENVCGVPLSGELVHIGNDDGVAEFSLGECQGDCDDDSDCQYGFVCQQRDENEPVSGCRGHGITMEDYCVKPKEGNHLVIMGDNGDPPLDFPLSECQGDCDSDDECAGAMKCFFRGSEPGAHAADSPVPGCTGWGDDGWDYCYDPSGTQNLDVCEYDCFANNDCKPGLKCKIREGDEDVPGCDTAGLSGKNMCYRDVVW